MRCGCIAAAASELQLITKAAVRTIRSALIAANVLLLGGCVTTSMQGYADLQQPPRPIQHIAVIAPPALVSALVNEASKRRVLLEDFNVVLPPTRQYTEAEVRNAMADHGIDGVLAIGVMADSGVQQRYAGTIVNSSYSGTFSGNATIVGNMIYGTGTSSGMATSTATPIYSYSRAVAWQARLSDPQTSRKFWVGSGQTRAGGALFMSDATNASDAASAIFNDLETKGLIGQIGT
jgi:hypothetical protein